LFDDAAKIRLSHSYALRVMRDFNELTWDC